MYGFWFPEQDLWERDLVKDAFLSTWLTAVSGLFHHLFLRLSLAVDSSMCLPLEAPNRMKCFCFLLER